MKRYREMAVLCVWFFVVVACGTPSIVEHGTLPTNQNHSAQSKDTKTSHSGQNSAEEGRTNGIEKEGKESPIEKLNLPSDLKKAVEEAGMPIYEGSEPPNVDVDGWRKAPGSAAILAAAGGTPTFPGTSQPLYRGSIGIWYQNIPI